MPKLIVAFFCVILSSCVSVGEPHINYVGAKKLNMSLNEIYTDFTNLGEVKDVIEITISSEIDIFKFSLEKSLALNARISQCSVGENIPSIIMNRIHFDGKEYRFYLQENSIMDIEKSDSYEYKVFLDYEDYLTEIRENGIDLCIQFQGSTYFYHFFTNKVRLPALDDL